MTKLIDALMTAEQQVKAVFPKACLFPCGDAYRVYLDSFVADHVAEAATEAEAWAMVRDVIRFSPF